MDDFLDILPAGKTAVAVKTDGRNFDIQKKGLSSTGCWIVNKNKVDDYVIVYLETQKENKVFLGEYAKKEPEGFTEKKGKKYPRYRIYIKELKLQGTTTKTWTEFTLKSSGGFERTYLINDGKLKPEWLNPEGVDAEEGYKKDAKFMVSTRDKNLANKRKKLDKYTCQACNQKIEINGKFVLDCHHKEPINLGKRRTKLDDLVSLCPTCHRVAHTRIPPLDIIEIKEYVHVHGE